MCLHEAGSRGAVALCLQKVLLSVYSIFCERISGSWTERHFFLDSKELLLAREDSTGQRQTHFLTPRFQCHICTAFVIFLPPLAFNLMVISSSDILPFFKACAFRGHPDKLKRVGKGTYLKIETHF